MLEREMSRIPNSHRFRIPIGHVEFPLEQQWLVYTPKRSGYAGDGTPGITGTANGPRETEQPEVAPPEQ